MILCVTPNTAIDHVVFIPAYVPGKTIRTDRSLICMAGKASDAAWVLSEMGVACEVQGFAGGGFGRIMESMLQARGIPTHFTWTGGETRLNTVVVIADGSPQTTLTTNTLQVQAPDVERLMQAYHAGLPGAGCVVLGGPWPPGIDPAIYAGMTRAARAFGVPVILDASPPALQAALPGRPSAIKPNRDELEALVGRKLPSLADVCPAAKQVQAEFGCAVIATLGGDGALAVLTGCTYFIPPLQVPMVNPAGAGDAVTAGLSRALAARLPWEDGLRWGFAAAGAVVQTEGTAWCSLDEMERLLPQVELLPYP